MTLLPEPDSPTTPSVRPASTEKETSRTARTTPSGVWNETFRCSTSSSAMNDSFPSLPVPTCSDVACSYLLSQTFAGSICWYVGMNTVLCVCDAWYVGWLLDVIG